MNQVRPFTLTTFYVGGASLFGASSTAFMKSVVGRRTCALSLFQAVLTRLFNILRRFYFCKWSGKDEEVKGISAESTLNM